MQNLKELSIEIGINYGFLKSLCLYPEKFYQSYYIQKKEGAYRIIDAPSYKMKAIQKWILRNILEKKFTIMKIVTGFVRGRGIKFNAKYHLGNRYIMCLDLKDFFFSIKIPLVLRVFESIYSNSEFAKQLARICTFRGYLPQGGVTSPTLSNIIFEPVDKEINRVCNENRVTYSRYADDLTFSSNHREILKAIQKSVEKILEQYDYKLNPRKTRFYSGKHRMRVTGILLNSEDRLTVGREKKRKIRADLFNYLVKKDTSVNLKKTLGNIYFIKDIEPGYVDKVNQYKNNLQKKFLE